MSVTNYSSGLPSGSSSFSVASSTRAPRHTSMNRARSALPGNLPRGSRCISACARFPGTGPSVTLRSLFPSASVSLRMSPALALIVPRVPRRPAIPPCASPVYRCPAFLLGPLEFPAGKRGLGRRTADSLLPSKGNLRSSSSSFSTIPGDPCVRSSSGNFSPRLANPYIPSRASSNHDMTRLSSSPPYLRKYPSLLSSLRVRLT